MSDLEQTVLSLLASNNLIEDTWNLALELQVDHQQIVGVLKSLLADNYVADEALVTKFWTLTEEGLEIATNGSPEYILYNAVPDGGISVSELQSLVGDSISKIGLGPCMKNKWLKKDGDRIVKIAEGIQDDTSAQLQRVQQLCSEVSNESLQNLKRRKLVQEITRKSFRVVKGTEFKPQRVRKMADITKEMLGDKSEMAAGSHWSDLEFKSVNLNAMGAPVQGGRCTYTALSVLNNLPHLCHTYE